MDKNTNNTHNEKWRGTVDARMAEDKEKVLSHLRRMPIILVACERAGVGRSTFNRWCDTNLEFKAVAKAAMREGREVLNAMAESQLLTLMKDKHWPAIRFYLEHNHPKYRKKILLEGGGEPVEFVMTFKQPH